MKDQNVFYKNSDKRNVWSWTNFALACPKFKLIPLSGFSLKESEERNILDAAI